MAGNGKLGFWYVVRWNINYVLLTVIGPAHLDGDKDPRARMRAERAEAERRAQGPDRG